MSPEGKKSKRLFKKLKHKYRLVFVQDDTFEEKLSIKLSRLNVFTIFGSAAILLIILVTSLIAYTPLREFIPGYLDTKLRKQVIENDLRVDSLKTIIINQEAMIKRIHAIIGGNEEKDSTIITENKIKAQKKPQPIATVEAPKNDYKISEKEEKLRAKVEVEKEYTLTPKIKGTSTELSTILLFPPLRGPITDVFNSTNHNGIDIVADHNEAIKAILDGTVIQVDWTYEDGYIIGLKHQNNLVSYYKQNSKVLKKVGDLVHAGEAIAIVGDLCSIKKGPHLHFELWVNGKPVNPKDYLAL